MRERERSAGYSLLERGVLVPFRVVETRMELSPDGESLSVCAEILFGIDDQEDPVDLAEWGSFGFIFALAVLSFADARPRGYSAIDFVENDEFGVDDFLRCLSFCRGELHFAADYIRGRSMKTDITVKPDGGVTLTTRGRGEAATRWLDRLQGKKFIQPV
jgi:hypothetical protein